jgi:hypothetical protein
MSESAGSKRELRVPTRGQAAHGRSRLPRMLLCLGLAVFLFLPGCSWIFVQPAKVDDYPSPECTTSRAAPVLDTINLLANVTGVAILASMEGSEERNTLMVSWAVWAGIHAASASYGFSNTSECIENRAAGLDRPYLIDPDFRPPPPKKRPSRLTPEPGVMRSN